MNTFFGELLAVTMKNTVFADCKQFSTHLNRMHCSMNRKKNSKETFFFSFCEN